MTRAAAPDGRLPNLVIAGVAKAATSSLFDYLGQHPDICAADLKELRYFVPLRYGEPLEPLDRYAAHFRHWTSESYALEATPGYFPGGEVVATAMDSTLPGARVVVILRDPADRCWSYYRFLRSRVRIPGDMSFAQYLDRCEELHDRGVDGDRENQEFWGLGGGCYSTWLDAWVDTFGARFRVVFFDDLARDPAGTVADICRWLGLDAGVATEFVYETDNKTLQYRNEKLQAAAVRLNRRQRLFFATHPGVKRSLRRAYQLVNGNAAREQPTDATRDRLERFYLPYNQRLGEQLAAIGVAEPPLWARRAS